ncbi:MAG: HAD family phosphatase [Prevotella sp.]|nr:HAD family phosphatase [Prevotella sp.]
MIKTVAFDLGGVIMTIDNDEPKRRLKEIGATDADKLLDPYVQSGYFGDLENGKISEEDFRKKLSEHVGRELTWKECQYVWTGYAKQVPHYSIEALQQIREMGYRIILASNTNGFMQAWADSEDFSGDGHALSYYFDRMYRSYEMGEMKPDGRFFRYILSHEQTLPEEILFVDDSSRNCAAASELGFRTYCPENGSDWSAAVIETLLKNKE